MSRRKLQWKKRAVQAGGLDKILPTATTGAGEWLTKGTIEGREMKMPTEGEYTKQCSLPMSARKEALVRVWTK